MLYVSYCMALTSIVRGIPTDAWIGRGCSSALLTWINDDAIHNVEQRAGWIPLSFTTLRFGIKQAIRASRLPDNGCLHVAMCLLFLRVGLDCQTARI